MMYIYIYIYKFIQDGTHVVWKCTPYMSYMSCANI